MGIRENSPFSLLYLYALVGRLSRKNDRHFSSKNFRGNIEATEKEPYFLSIASVDMKKN